MTFLANLLVVGPGLLLLLLSRSRRTGPEGPVGAPLVTAPLALAVAAGLGIGLASAPLAPWGIAAWVPWLVVPGLVVGLCLLPVLALEARYRLPGSAAVLCGVLGGLVLNLGPLTSAPATAALVGLVLTAVPSLAGYGLLAAFWWQQQRAAVAQLRADAERRDRWQSEQAEWQRTEWRKLPPQPDLWQLIQFAHAFAPEVQAECRARIAALPDLDGAMVALLGTGWAEHSLAYLRDAYPRSRAPLAPALAACLERQCAQWRGTLDGASQPGSYYGNVFAWIAAAEAVSADGGDVRAAMGAWAEMLQGRAGLGELAARARAVAAGRSTS